MQINRRCTVKMFSKLKCLQRISVIVKRTAVGIKPYATLMLKYYCSPASLLDFIFLNGKRF